MLFDGCAKCVGEVGGRSRDENTAPGGGAFNNNEVVGLGERLDFLEVGRVGAIIGGVMLPRQVFTFPGSLIGMETVCRQASERSLASHSDGDLKSLVGR